MVAIFLLVVLGFALYSGSIPSMPKFQGKGKRLSKYTGSLPNLYHSNNQNKKYKGFKDFLMKKEKEDSLRKLKKVTPGNSAEKIPYIRAAFYTPWTANTSLPDLGKIWR